LEEGTEEGTEDEITPDDLEDNDEEPHEETIMADGDDQHSHDSCDLWFKNYNFKLRRLL